MGKSRWSTLAGLVVASVVTILSARDVHTQTAPCYVTTVDGDIQGSHIGGACAFLGVPFGASTAGNQRWKPPLPVAPWTPAVLDATVAAAGCPALNNAGQAIGSEDCLKLNVWTPDAPAADRGPVIVWFHTGGFTSTSANFAAHNGKRMAEETGAIVVAAWLNARDSDRATFRSCASVAGGSGRGP